MTTRHAIAGLVFAGLSTLLVPRVEASDVIYAATSHGVFKTTDGGASWTASNTGLAGVSVFSLAIDPKTPTTVYAGTFGNRVFKSTDAGQHWRPASTGFADDTALSLAIDPLNPATLYSGTTNSGTTTSSSRTPTAAFFPGRGVFKSSNGAEAWAAANPGLPPAIVTAVALAPSNPAVLYAGTNVAGVFKTTNGGLSWTAANAGINSSDISDVVVDPDNPNVVYVGIEGCSAGCSSPAGVFKSTDGGTTWVSSNLGLMDDLQVVALALDPTNTRVLYAGTRFDGIFKSSDAGASWSSINPALTGTLFAIVHFSLVTDPVNAGTVYAGTFDGVFKSTDGGKNWTASNDGLPASPRIFALALHSQR